MTPEEIIRILKLEPHPKENGYFIETYRSDEIIMKKWLPSRYNGPRTYATAIYFLLKRGGFSEMHRLASR